MCHQNSIYSWYQWFDSECLYINFFIVPRASSLLSWQRSDVMLVISAVISISARVAEASSCFFLSNLICFLINNLLFYLLKQILASMAKFVSTYEKPLSHIGLPDWYAKQWQLRQSADVRRSEACQLRNSGKTVRSEANVRTKWDTCVNNARIADRWSQIT